MKTKNTRKTRKGFTKTGRRSMKGKHGKVGAPPKATKFPTTPFTIKQLEKRNSNQCQLSLRNKVDTMLDSGELISITPKKQAKGGVGRPAPRYVTKDNFDASKHEVAPRPVKTGKRPASVTVTNVVAPTPAPEVTQTQPEAVAAVPQSPVETVPVVPEVSAPVETPANVIQAPTQPEVTAPATEVVPVQQAA